MLRVCYCGTLAIRYDRQEIVRKTVSMVKEFEEAREAQFNKDARPPLLLNEYSIWRETVMGCKKAVTWDEDDAGEVAASLVDPEDTGKFMAEGWGIADSVEESQDGDAS